MSDKYRINGFRQIEAFYSLVFSGRHNFSPQHISLYMFLLNQNNRANWVEWFKCPYDLAMNGAMIGSKKTYYSCLKDLKDWEVINYEAGENQFKAPKISLRRLDNEPQLIPQCEPAPAPLLIPAPAPLPTTARVRYINYITSNLNNLVTKNIKQLQGFDFDFEKCFLITELQNDSNQETGGSFSNPQQQTEPQKFLLTEMITKYIQFNPDYMQSKFDDLQGARKIAEFIADGKGVEHVRDDEILNVWEVCCKGINALPFWKGKSLKTISNNFQTIRSEIIKLKNGESSNGKKQSAKLNKEDGFAATAKLTS